MKKVATFVQWIKEKLFNQKVELNIEAEQTENTNITQTANVFNFIIPSILLSIVLIAIVIWGINQYQKSKYDLSPMNGNLNVAVVRFSDWTKGGCDIERNSGTLIANAFYAQLESDRLKDQFYQNSNILLQLRSPNELSALSGNTNDEVTKSAENLAVQINAQIVIYGVITCSELTEKPSYQVIFYVAPASFGDAQELIGEFSFSSDTLSGGITSGQDYADLNKSLQQKVEIISLVVKSIASYLGENYSRSLDFLSNALDSSLWESQSGEEVIYIIAGNAATKLGLNLLTNGNDSRAISDIEQARDYYNKANAITVTEGKGDYARSYIGLAGVENFYANLKTITSNNINDMDLSAIKREQDLLDKAEIAVYSPITADIPQKVAFDRAQISLAFYQLREDIDYLGSAKTNYLSIISSYNDGNIRIREMAAHSYAGLAIIARITRDAKSAISDYEFAIQITRIPSLQAQYLLQLGNTYYENGDQKSALPYYEETLKRKSDLKNRVPASIITDLETKVEQIKQSLPTTSP
jgi:tetratricopeptide (TPR) repeat protein